MPRKPKCDWEALEQEWRTGQYSNLQLARNYGISESGIRKRAIKHEWKKDLVEEYQKGIAEALVRDGANEKTNPAPFKSSEQIQADKAVVDEAVKVGVHVVREHRKAIGKLASIKIKLTEKLETAIEEEPDEDNNLPSLIGFKSYHESVFDVLSKLSGITSNIIKLERQAFNMDAKEKENPQSADLEDRIKENMKKNGFKPS